MLMILIIYNITTYFGLQNNKNNNKYTKAAKYI